MRLSLDNPVLDYMNTAVQFIALNLVYLICCLPVITIGPATAALYQVTLREARKEHGYLIRKFFQHFKEMFFQGIFTFLIFAALLFAAAYALAFWFTLGTPAGTAAFTFTLLLMVVIFCAMIYVFALMARFENSLFQTVKNAFLFTLSHPAYSLALFLIQVFIVSLLYLFPAMKICMIAIGFSFTAYCNSLIFTRLFRPYENTEDMSLAEGNV